MMNKPMDMQLEVIREFMRSFPIDLNDRVINMLDSQNIAVAVVTVLMELTQEASRTCESSELLKDLVTELNYLYEDPKQAADILFGVIRSNREMKEEIKKAYVVKLGKEITDDEKMAVDVLQHLMKNLDERYEGPPRCYSILLEVINNEKQLSRDKTCDEGNLAHMHVELDNFRAWRKKLKEQIGVRPEESVDISKLIYLKNTHIECSAHGESANDVVEIPQPTEQIHTITASRLEELQNAELALKDLREQVDSIGFASHKDAVTMHHLSWLQQTEKALKSIQSHLSVYYNVNVEGNKPCQVADQIKEVIDWLVGRINNPNILQELVDEARERAVDK